MKLLEKANFEVFEWLDLERLSNSKGYKFEIYSDYEVNIKEFVSLFYSLFGKYIYDMYIGQLGSKAEWGDFCIDIWDIKNDDYDYSTKGKSEPTAKYLQMLMDNNIEPEYVGIFKCLDWNTVLPVILNCILAHTAPYSPMFYVQSHEFVFYFHHTGSIGIYYKELNDEMKSILETIKEENLEIKYANDERVKNYN